MDLRTKLPSGGRFLSIVPQSLLSLGGVPSTLKKLPVEMPQRPWLLSILTLKNRSSSPVVGLFIECARDVTKTITREQRP